MTIRVGIIGLGIMGRRMAQRMVDHGGFAVVAGWDPDPLAVAATRELAPEMDGRAGADQLVATADLDLVYVASPPATHLAHAALAFDAGKPVLCEKPLAVDLREAERMVERVDRENLRAAVNYPIASTAALAYMAEALRSEALGRIRAGHVEAAFRTWPRPWQQAAAFWLDGRAEGGFTREVVSHFLFVLRRLLGPLDVLDSKVSYPEEDRSERELTAKVTAGGVLITLSGHVGRIEADDRNSTMVEGEDGALRLANWTTLERGTATGWVPVPEAKDPRPVGHRHLDAVADWLAGRPHPLASFGEALEVQRTVERLLAGV
ncbi:Gfo/Idh/MocA family protein [Indioceanicola profundi]|uniref:Gfo/Idh/MocA family protein n=1 Tax=Indioceanicola profundi TaxID=2220096 RepID=UPI000E6AB4BD|nr:Gfo/Idh/MocA family oxidoreductase [Indioceanicola profundi]